MAERRMFAKTVIGSARFLRMPATSRLLYYDLGMEADDDGCVEAFGVIRKTGATEDDLRVLASRGFVHVLNDDLVSYITDWSKNNYIRKDRYQQGIYTKLLIKLNDKIDGIPADNQKDINGIPDDNQRYTQDRLGKDSIGKDSISACKESSSSIGENARARFFPPSVEEVRIYCNTQGYATIDPERFVSYYNAINWKIGNTPMTDWQSAVQSWHRRDMEKANGTGKNESNPAWTIGTVV